MRKHSNFQTPLGNPSIQTHLVLVCCIKRLCIFGPKGTIQIYALLILLSLLLYDTEDDLLCFLFTIQNVRFVQIQTFQIIPTTFCQVFLGLYLGRSFSTGKVDPRGSRMMPLLQLWPPDPQSWPILSLALWTICTDLMHNQCIRFQNTTFNRLVRKMKELKNGLRKHLLSRGIKFHMSLQL